MKKLVLLFQGDSVTDSGRSKDTKECNDALGSGYAALIASKILYEHPTSEIYNRGYNGNRIADMYARWEEDALNIPFNVISIMNGINDVGFGIRQNCGANAQKFKFIYDRILYETRDAKPDADIILCKPYIIRRVYEKENDIYENWDTWKDAIIERGEIVRELAEKYGCTVVETMKAFDDALKKAPAEHWTKDCIHPTHAGSDVIARAWLKAAEPILNKYF